MNCVISQPQTADDYRMALYVNTGLAMDAGLSLSVGGEGVGLYRSEVPFMTRDRFPSEEEQRVIYRQNPQSFCAAYGNNADFRHWRR